MNTDPSPNASSRRADLQARRYGRLTRSLTRTTRMVVVGGVAVGAGLTAMAGIATAASSSPTRTTTPAAPTTLPPGPRGLRGPGRRGGPGGALGVLGAPGAGGTITAIDGSTLVLRTMNGTETVDTSSATKFDKERESIVLGDLRVGEVVRVRGKPVSTATSSSRRSEPGVRTPPGTGTVDATRVTVVEPVFFGRVLSESGGVVTLAGPDGQLLTVHTTSSTRYYRGQARTSPSVVSDGAHIMAEGDRTSLTNLDAAVVTVAPSRPSPAPGLAPNPPRPPAGGMGSSARSS